MPQDLSSARRAEHFAAQWTIGLLFACLALEAAAIARPEAVGALKLPVLVGTGLMWLLWLRRAYGNLALVGSRRTRFGRRWAIGVWLIPFLNVVRAYEVMKDLWLRTNSMNDRDGYDDLPPSALLPGWWGISLAWGALVLVTTWLTEDAFDLRLPMHAVGIVAIILAIRVVRGIDRTQQAFLPGPPDLPTPQASARHFEVAPHHGVNASRPARSP
ncbi:MAG TPA: DUF4328 domain-containing protein [Gemmatimonadales bacterium]|nr:DUF4328 domain-containing protein [Gemmatimonadales bacterium]